MTETENRQTENGLLADRRARVPFAIIAVLLLVSAVAVVGYLETRGSAETETDAAVAMDQTEATIQTTLRDATATAAMQAAAEPLTRPANTSYGDALDEERPFVSYFEALVYLTASERFGAAGQRVGDVETAVSLPEITDDEAFEAALERVSLTEEEGLVTVELGGIEITATRDGEQVASRTETVEVSVPTPVIRQHERTQTFQERLDAGVTSSGSFSQRFNARTYALGWARGYAQYGGAPVTEVIANRHVEPSANSALYRTQQSVFGAADPNLSDAVRRGWFCMATQDAEALYEGYSGGQADVADDICEASEWILGEKHTGELPDPPDTLDLLGEAPGMDAEHTIGVNETAYTPLRTLVSGSGENSIEAAIERIFTVETAIVPDIHGISTPTFDHERPHPEAEVVDTERTHEGITATGGTATTADPAANGTYYRFSGFDTAVEVTEQKTWEWTDGGEGGTATTADNGTLDGTVTVELTEHDVAPTARIDEFNEGIGVEYRYEPGPASPDDERTVPAPGFPNYAEAVSGVADGVVGGTDPAAFEEWLASQWDGVTGKEELALPGTVNATLDLDPEHEAALVGTALDDIGQLQGTVENITHTFERTDLVRGADETGPVGNLAKEVETERDTHLERAAAYESVGQKAVYEIRSAYFGALLEDLQTVDAAHGAAMDELDDQLDGLDSGLDQLLSFLQEGTSDGTDGGEGPPLDSPDITPEITYEVRGSPTYLAGEVVTSEDVPAVDAGQEFAPFAAQNRDQFKLPYEEIVGGVVDRVFDALGLGSADAELTLRTAGETLRAGELAEDAATADGEYADAAELGALTGDLEAAVEDALTGYAGFSSQMGVELVAELYGVEPDFSSSLNPTLYYQNETHQTAYELTEAAATAVVDEYDSVAEAAIAIGEGNATDGLVAEMEETLDDENLTRPGYAGQLASEDWQAVVGSAVRPALDRAAANATATIDGTDLVEELDTATRQALENVSIDIIEDRIESHVADGTFDLSAYEDWVGDGDDIDTPVRVPAGLPLIPFPTKWVATMNVWDIEADGKYARFELEANMSAPGRATSTTYVRENATVETEIAGGNRTLGEVDPISFDGRSLLTVVVPSGGIGVGDRDDENPECTETYPVVGPFDEEDAACGPSLGDVPGNATADP